MAWSHGYAGHSDRNPTYRAWEGLKQRCNQEKCKRFSDYGGRGISYEERWESFSNFLEDMGEAPAGMSLDRRDNDGNYSKENCQWATSSQQNLNRRAPKTNTSNIKGVSWINGPKRWQASGKLNKKSTNLYSGSDFFLAVCARKSWENKTGVAK
jgi:hypothetical protein